MPTGATASSTHTERPVVNPWLITLAITIGALMGALDTSIVNVALPYIRANLGVSVTEVAWISTGYIIALVIIMPMTAWLGTRFGRKRVYMACLLLFTAASFCCGAARTLPVLTLFRLLQGLGAGALQPIQQAILRETFPEEKQGMAMGIFGLAVMIGPAIGPTLGGWITDNYNWPWIFYINVPIGAVGLWMVGRYIHDPAYLTESKAKVRVDGFGIALLTIGLASLQGVLEEGQTMDWFTSNIIIALTVAAVVSLSTFIWWELRTDAPVVDLSVLKSASFTTGTVIGGLLGVSLYSSMFILPLFLQELIGYDATQSGLVLMPRSLVMLVMMPAMGLFYNRIGPRPMIGSGLVVAGVAAIMMSQFTLFTTNAGFLWPQMIQGLGFSLIFVALSTTTLNGIEHRKMTSATGLYNLVRQLGGSFGTAIFATMLETGQQSGRAALVGHIDPFHPAFVYKLQLLEQGLMMRGVDAWTAHLQALKIMEGMVEQQAAVLSFGHAFFLIGVLFFICIPLVFVLKAGGPADGASLSHAAVD